jgi:hypothetical protein
VDQHIGNNKALRHPILARIGTYQWGGKNADRDWIRKIFQILINFQSFQLSLTPGSSGQGN